MRSVYEEVYIEDRPTTDQRPTSHWENFKWPYLREGSSDPLHVLFYGGVFGVGGSIGAISGSIISKMAADGHLGTAAILE